MEARLGPVLDALNDGADAPLVVLALARVPFEDHSTLHLACRRLNTIIESRAFREWRVERGLYGNSEWLDLAVPGAPAAVGCEVASIFLG